MGDDNKTTDTTATATGDTPVAGAPVVTTPVTDDNKPADVPVTDPVVKPEPVADATDKPADVPVVDAPATETLAGGTV